MDNDYYTPGAGVERGGMRQVCTIKVKNFNELKRLMQQLGIDL